MSDAKIVSRYMSANKIFEILRDYENRGMVAAKLRNKFNLNDYKSHKLSQMCFDMLTKAEYLETNLDLSLNIIPKRRVL